ncbi:MAG: COX15/CtaA family protein [Maribacter sp.]|nr:COX15/CtaA family protein [Maribacter sp.]
MNMTFRKLAKISIILVYLVILAGAVVRMTGSGMGCPDWPKCFGYYIPPTNISELEWKPDHEYKKGQVIILDASLQVATSNFKTTTTFDKSHWEPYTKHDYANFNASHTWVEFINRLLGALAGLATLVLALFSIKYWKKKKIIPILSWLVVFGMIFQAWLGATVVFSVLEPAKITIHMFMALCIVAMLLYLMQTTSSTTAIKQLKQDTLLIRLLTFALLVTLIQILLGTQVRQFVDDRIDLLGETAKDLWLQQPILQFYVHRSFSIFVALLNGYIAYRIYRLKLGYSKIKWVLILILAEIFTGIVMYYLHFPYATQPLHLFLASMLFGVQFYLILEALKAVKSPKTL